ncbi:MAG TPA: hypothetical protein VMI94_13090 [Bryobacteraceae bacterium]|nr:hypothetical protein [Bryobacteraceae bacterium]
MFLLRPVYWLALVLAMMDLPLPAQVGYPGQYPPPNGGVGIPVPRRSKKKEQQAQLQSADGMLRRMRKDEVVLEADDHRIINFKRDDKTRFLKEGNPIQAADLKPGDYIEVEFSEDDEGFLTAVNVSWQQDGTEKDRAHALEPVDISVAKNAHDRAKAPEVADEDDAQAGKAVKPGPAPGGSKAPVATADDANPADLKEPDKEQPKVVQIDPDDLGPPVLSRGGKVARREAAPAPAQPAEEARISDRNVPAEEPPAAQPAVTGPLRPEEAIIEKAREAAGSFLQTLPNYFCQEVMTRYQSGTLRGTWQPMDVVSMALVFDKGEESYRNIQVNGKPTKKKMEDLAGAWSTGEFGSVLADLFSPATEADFEFRKESRTGGRPAMLYDYTVEREHSHWRIMIASQLVEPSYAGSVWVDKETKRVLRIEMQATHMPDAFPVDKVEMATDYQFIRIGDREYLVPVHAETLGCQRDSDQCTHNVIDFRNYHRYSGESSISFENN